ncbi:phage tail protein [Hymenobacter sublimis]|uniref:Phage tail protein n=1 Tax=Hymenobacter sublimis TaxID=2933777 RepID=A0ABY4JCJ3_9BACT|nr:phage tail protein [Hymenobacter sublimis]UPL50529.1 phage tail protein [Hymenobacter sublimis]
MINEVIGTEVAIKVNSKTLGCAESANFSTKFDMVDVSCMGSKGFKTQKPGAESWDGSISAVFRVINGDDAATNVSMKDMYTILRSKTLFDIEYELGGLDGEVFTSKAYLTNVDISIPKDGAVTWTANLVGAAPLVMEA